MLKCAFQYQQDNCLLNIELEMQQSLLGIVGASGCGKSTLLKNIVGLLKPTQGYIQFNQHILVDTRQNIQVPMHQRKIALIFNRLCYFASECKTEFVLCRKNAGCIGTKIPV